MGDTESRDRAPVDDFEQQAGARRGALPRRKTRTQVFRDALRWVIVAYVLLISIAHTLTQSWAANLHTICPFGGVANLYTYFSTGNYVNKLHSAVFIMLLALAIGLILTGKSFCGWICPLGTIQDGLNAAGRKLWPSAYDKLPRKVESVLRYAKFAILALVLIQTARTGKLMFQNLDPYYNLFNIWTDEIAVSGYVVVAATVLLALFVPRPFCRFACPLGALNGLFNSFSFLNIKREVSSCIDCGRCDRVCPVKIRVSQVNVVRDVECTRCLKCVESCPVNKKTGSTLKVRTWFDRPASGKSGRAVATPVLWSLALAAFVIPIVVAMASGNFGITAARTFGVVEDIRGSSALSDVIENYNVSAQELYNGFGIPESVAPSTKLKDVQTAMGISGEEIVSPETIREAIRYIDQPLQAMGEQAGIPAERVAEVAKLNGLPATALVREHMQGGVPGSIAYLLTGSWPGEAGGGAQPGDGGGTATTSPTPATTTTSVGPATSTTKAPGTGGGTGTGTGGGGTGTTSETTPDIKGTTTLGEMRAKVKDFDAFLAAFAISPDEADSVTLKELAGKYGFEITAVRDYVAQQ